MASSQPSGSHIAAIVPALNEAAAIEGVVHGLRRHQLEPIIVADNGSTDATAMMARRAGALVVPAQRRGYGSACLVALSALRERAAQLGAMPQAVLFADGDGSDDHDDIPALLAPIRDDRADLVVGSRALGTVAAGALTPQQRMGNVVAASWLRLRFGLRATDLGPLRAVRWQTLLDLEMSDPDFGWTVEMQIKAALNQTNIRYSEVPVRYHKRLGHSKISGTIRGSLGAAAKILGLLAYHDLRSSLRGSRQ